MNDGKVNKWHELRLRGIISKRPYKPQHMTCDCSRCVLYQSAVMRLECQKQWTVEATILQSGIGYWKKKPYFADLNNYLICVILLKLEHNQITNRKPKKMCSRLQVIWRRVSALKYALQAAYRSEISLVSSPSNYLFMLVYLELISLDANWQVAWTHSVVQLISYLFHLTIPRNKTAKQKTIRTSRWRQYNGRHLGTIEGSYWIELCWVCHLTFDSQWNKWIISCLEVSHMFQFSSNRNAHHPITCNFTLKLTEQWFWKQNHNQTVLILFQSKRTLNPFGIFPSLLVKNIVCIWFTSLSSKQKSTTCW